MLRDWWNLVLRVDVPAAPPRVLRIGKMGNRSLLDIQSEVSWLQAIHRDSDLVVPVPVPTPEGEFVISLPSTAGEQAVHCVLFSWVDGEPVNEVTPRIAALLGDALARLHDHAERWTPPPRFTRSTYDRVWMFFRPDPIYADTPHPVFTARRREVLRAAAQRAQRTIDELHRDPAQLRFLHMDLHCGNVKLTNGSLNVLDFDDSLWGHPLQDMAVSLMNLVIREDGPALRAAFVQGYAARRPLPEDFAGRIDACIESRALDLVSYELDPESPEEIADLERRYLTLVRLFGWE